MIQSESGESCVCITDRVACYRYLPANTFKLTSSASLHKSKNFPLKIWKCAQWLRIDGAYVLITWMLMCTWACGLRYVFLHHVHIDSPPTTYSTTSMCSTLHTAWQKGQRNVLTWCVFLTVCPPAVFWLVFWCDPLCIMPVSQCDRGGDEGYPHRLAWQ